ncbi:ankyrin repeat domain-containing protein [Halocynthiibacter sp.]|uniref:ankyrin repeat domain-containing protein n=1 Tax=Halocynthiibacter sp. TaxID=1979210 RepID=UPI003C5369D7
MKSLNSKVYDLINANEPQKLREHLASGGDPNSPINDLGWTPLQLTIEIGHHKIFDVLLDAGADINGFDNHGFTVLHHAVDAEADGAIQTGEVPLPEFTHKLLNKGVKLSLKSKRGETAIDLARKYQYDAFLKLVSKLFN